jgi:biotin carboxyl carrier protein
MKKFIITVNDKKYEVEVEEVKKSNISVPVSSNNSNGNIVNNKVVLPGVSESKSNSNSSAKINAPMPGSILRVNVSKGDSVTKGQSLIILEAMKMENEIKSPVDGKISFIKVTKGESVNLGQTLLEIA